MQCQLSLSDQTFGWGVAHIAPVPTARIPHHRNSNKVVSTKRTLVLLVLEKTAKHSQNCHCSSTRSFFFDTTHVPDRNVMRLQDRHCICTSKQFPSSLVICPSPRLGCLLFCLSGHETVCAFVSLFIQRLVPPTPTLLRPRCAHACYIEQTLHHMISAGRWEIPFIFPLFFPSLPFSSPCFLQMCWYPGISCQAVLTFCLAADQAAHVFRFLIPVRKQLSELIKERGGGTITVVLFRVARAPSKVIELSLVTKTLICCSWNVPL